MRLIYFIVMFLIFIFGILKGDFISILLGATLLLIASIVYFIKIYKDLKSQNREVDIWTL